MILNISSLRKKAGVSSRTKKTRVHFHSNSIKLFLNNISCVTLHVSQSIDLGTFVTMVLAHRAKNTGLTLGADGFRLVSADQGCPCAHANPEFPT